MIWTYADDGTRAPFDPAALRLAGCLLCGWPVVTVGVFVPADDAMRAAVLTLRRRPAPATSAACLAYGLCAEHSEDLDASCLGVEARLAALAAKVVLQ